MTLAIIFATATTFFSLPPDLLAAICYVESGHKISKVHENDGPSHSYGVCQIKLETAQGLGFKGSEKELMKPQRNIYWAAKYLHHQLKRYKQNVPKAVIAYNQGHAGDLKSTNYSRRVLAAWKDKAWE